MKNLPAKIISVILHPLLLPTYAIIFFSQADTYFSIYNDTVKKTITTVIFLSTFIAPLIFFLILLNLRQISSLTLKNRKERFLPYAATLLFYIATYIVLIQFPVKIPFVITGFILLSAFSVFVTMLINLNCQLILSLLNILQ